MVSNEVHMPGYQRWGVVLDRGHFEDATSSTGLNWRYDNEIWSY